jgi:hypothetical protein
MTTKLKFADIKVGGLFVIDGEKFKKSGPATYYSVENPILGEYTIQPFTEARIQAVPTPVKVVVKSVAASKKVVGKPVKKPAAKKIVAKKKK